MSLILRTKNNTENTGYDSSDNYQIQPTLHRCNAIRRNPCIKITAENYVPAQNITIQFSHYSYIRYNKSLVRGYIRNLSSKHVELETTNLRCLCIKYYVNKEDGFYQLGFQIFSILKQLKRRSINLKLLTFLVAKLLKLKKPKHHKKVTFYVNELIRLKYFDQLTMNNTKDNFKSGCYVINVQQVILFGRTVKY
eukprot:204531_1